VGWNKNKVEIGKNEASAADSIKVTTSPQKTNTTISGTVRVVFESGDFNISKAAAIVYLLDTNNVALFVQNIKLEDAVRDNTTMEKEAYVVRTGSFNFPNLNPSTTYVLKTVASQTTPLWASTIVSAAGGFAGGVVAGIFTLNPLGMAVGIAIGAKLADPGTESNETSIGESPAITTNSADNPQVVTLDKNVNVNQNYLDSILPQCPWNFWSNIGGCFGSLLYWAVFKPTSVLFALSGTLFDKTFSYSVQDSSYRSTFVVQGWGLVRDFCNLFFIFIMLYIAIGTILNLHSVKTKETIINIVIIGLFINFSLFATQVIIDASNITARVFYNSDAIKVGPKIDGVIQNAPGSTGEIKLSEALVSKINPQKLIINASDVGNITAKGNIGSDGTQKNGISASTFILVILLTSAINIVGIIVFISVGLMFVARVIGLWLAMILAPLAFFTYILPEMSSIKMIGWKNWWPDTLKMAFLAPVFIFFLYIIIKFLDTGLGLFSTDGKSGLDFILGITIPFIFIMIFLIKAKGIASDMSGEIGKQITGGIAATGGMLLGGAALGTALLGRRVVGAGIAKMSRMEGATPENLDKIKTEKIKFNDNLEKWKAADPKTRGAKPTWEDHKKANAVPKTNVFSRLGAQLNKSQRDTNKIDHARHEIDETKKAAGLVDANGNILEDSNISGEDENKLKTTFNKTKRSDVETNARKGLDATGKNEARIVDEKGRSFVGEKAFKSKNREEVAAELKKDSKNLDKNGELKGEVQKKMEDELDIKLNAAVKVTTDAQLEGLFKHLREESKQNVSMLTRGFARSNKASYDVRNISQVNTDKRDGFFNKIPTAMIAGVALGVRAGLKSSGVNHGQGQGDAIKDIGATITEALKGVKIEVPKAPTSTGGDAHGGGGAHH